MAGQPIAWVNNQFRQYVYDVTNLVNSTSGDDWNITVSFESAYTYGMNVTARPDVEQDPIVVNVSLIAVCPCGRLIKDHIV